MNIIILKYLKPHILFLQIYLSQFGYLPASARNPSSGGLIDESTWNKAVVDFQQFAGLNATGKFSSNYFLNTARNEKKKEVILLFKSYPTHQLVVTVDKQHDK